MPQLTIRLLGTPQIALDGVPITVDTRKAIALLAYLAVEGQAQSRAVLATLLWPESDEARGRSALRRTLTALNQAIGKAWLTIDRRTIALPEQPNLWLDVQEWRSLLTTCGGDVHEGQLATCIPILQKAVSLYRGDFLAGFTLLDSAEFDEWQAFHTESYRQALAGALGSLARCYEAQGEYEAAIQVERRWLALDPLHEPAHQALMRTYAIAGQRAAAMRQYEECAQILKETLGVQPQPETAALYEQVVTGTLAKWATTSTPPPSSIHLPRQLTSFVGRDKELAEIERVLGGKNGRLVTIMGPGGIGKTRLALEAAQRQHDYAHGVYFVPLAPVSSADYLVALLADVLDFSFYGGRGGLEEQKAQLLDFMREKEMLLVLDNFEHLLEGAELVDEILKTAPGVSILVTSQERLNLLGESLVEIYGLQCPANGSFNMESCSAVALFVQRASQVNGDFALTEEVKPSVARICRLVSGLPLGLELASTWVRMLSCDEIAAQIERDLDFLETSLRNIPPRHRSLRAVFEHSWRLLSDQEQLVLGKLAVFRGGFDAAAAQAVAGALLSHLLTLIDKSLLHRVEGGRYAIPDVLRQYALEKVKTAVQAQVQADHAGYYGRFLQAREAALTGENQAQALAQIGADIENIRQMWRWAIAREDKALLDQSLEGLYRFYQTRSWFQEGAEMLGQAVTLADEGSLLLGRALSRQGRLLVRLWQLDAGQAALERGLAVLRPFDNPREAASILSILGVIAEMRGDYSTAKQQQEESWALYHKIGEAWGEANVLLRLGNVAYVLGEFAEARRYYRESLALRERTGDRRGIALCLNNLGSVADTVGEYEEAWPLYRESVAIKREIGDRRGLAYSLNNLGHLGWLVGKHETAEADLNECLAIFHDIGDRKGSAFALTNLGNLAQARQAYAQAQQLYQKSLAVARELDYKIGMAYALNHLGTNCRQMADYEGAVGYYRLAMQAALAVKATPVMLEILIEVAVLLTAEQKWKQANRLLATILAQPAARKHVTEKAQALLTKLGEPLAEAQPLDVVVNEVLGTE